MWIQCDPDLMWSFHQDLSWLSLRSLTFRYDSITTWFAFHRCLGQFLIMVWYLCLWGLRKLLSVPDTGRSFTVDVLNGSRLCVVCFVWVLFAVFCFGAGHPVFCIFTCSPTARSVDRPCHELDRHSLKKKQSRIQDSSMMQPLQAPSQASLILVMMWYLETQVEMSLAWQPCRPSRRLPPIFVSDARYGISNPMTALRGFLLLLVDRRWLDSGMGFSSLTNLIGEVNLSSNLFDEFVFLWSGHWNWLFLWRFWIVRFV